MADRESGVRLGKSAPAGLTCVAGPPPSRSQRRRNPPRSTSCRLSVTEAGVTRTNVRRKARLFVSARVVRVVAVMVFDEQPCAEVTPRMVAEPSKTPSTKTVTPGGIWPWVGWRGSRGVAPQPFVRSAIGLTRPHSPGLPPSVVASRGGRQHRTRRRCRGRDHRRRHRALPLTSSSDPGRELRRSSAP